MVGGSIPVDGLNGKKVNKWLYASEIEKETVLIINGYYTDHYYLSDKKMLGIMQFFKHDFLCVFNGVVSRHSIPRSPPFRGIACWLAGLNATPA